MIFYLKRKNRKRQENKIKKTVSKQQPGCKAIMVKYLVMLQLVLLLYLRSAFHFSKA